MKRDKLNPVIVIIALIIVFSTMTGFWHLPDVMYYLAIGLFGVYSFLRSKSLKISGILVLAILFVCLLSLLVNNPPAFFRAYDRLGVYSLIVILVGPVLYSAYYALNKKNLLRALMLFYTILAFGSFIGYFLGINYFTRLGELYEIGMGTFSGLTSHSMALGPVAAMASVYLFVKLFVCEKKHRVANVVLLLGCIGSTLLSASRAAVGGLLVALLIVLWRIYRGKIKRFFRVVLVLVIIVTATFPIWGGFAGFLQEKQKANIEQGGTFYSRESKTDARIREFKESPIIGIGYCTIDPSLDYVNIKNGQIEPGSSWLAIASMTGLLGLLLFIILFYKAFKASVSIPEDNLSAFFTGTLAFFLVHMVVEGYIYAPKSFLSMTLWLLMGAIFGMSKYYKNSPLPSVEETNNVDNSKIECNGEERHVLS